MVFENLALFGKLAVFIKYVRLYDGLQVISIEERVMKKRGPKYGIRNFQAKADRWLVLSNKPQLSINQENLMLVLNAIQKAFNRDNKVATAWVMATEVDSLSDADVSEKKAREAERFAFDPIDAMGYVLKTSLIRTSLGQGKFLLELMVQVLNVKKLPSGKALNMLFKLQKQKAARNQYLGVPRLRKK